MLGFDHPHGPHAGGQELHLRKTWNEHDSPARTSKPKWRGTFVKERHCQTVSSVYQLKLSKNVLHSSKTETVKVKVTFL